MDINTLAIAMASMGGLGGLFSIGLAIADKKLHVEEDPRIGQILDSLPGANCGGCGLPGCGAFAEGVVLGECKVTGCPVNSADGIAEIAAIMGVEAVQEEKKVAVVFCQGDNREAAIKGDYMGVQTCLSAHLNRGGDKLCEYGCLGLADCVKACPFDAIKLNEYGIPRVDAEKCTACNNCVVACPRNLIELHNQSANLFVLCKSMDEAKYGRSVCTKFCTGCGACAKAVEGDFITVKDKKLAIVHHDQFPGTKVEELPTKKCPTNALVMLDKDRNFIS